MTAETVSRPEIDTILQTLRRLPQNKLLYALGLITGIQMDGKMSAPPPAGGQKEDGRG